VPECYRRLDVNNYGMVPKTSGENSSLQAIVGKLVSVTGDR